MMYSKTLTERLKNLRKILSFLLLWILFDRSTTFWCICLSRNSSFFNWSIVDLQCVNFCCTAKWLSYTHIYILFFFLATPCGMWHAGSIFVPQPGIVPAPPALVAWSLNHWTAKEVPIYSSFLKILFICGCIGRCCAWAFSSCSKWGLLFVAVHRLLIAVASLVADLGL